MRGWGDSFSSLRLIVGVHPDLGETSLSTCIRAVQRWFGMGGIAGNVLRLLVKPDDASYLLCLGVVGFIHVASVVPAAESGHRRLGSHHAQHLESS